MELDTLATASITDKVVADITSEGNMTIITFTDGTTQQLIGKPFEITTEDLQLERCYLCGQPSAKYPLFTIDNYKYLCRDCTLLAYNTYINNGYSMEETEHKK